MPFYHRFLSRRCLLTFVAVAALLFGLAMLHPYPRQSLFGPTIRGKPWCAWEDAVRRYRHHEKYQKTITAKTQRWLGITPKNLDREELFNHAEMFPLLLALTEDPDRDIRQCALQCFIQYDKFHDPTVIPVLRRSLDDTHADCRIRAASAIWLIDRTQPMLEVLQREIEAPLEYTPTMALSHLASWSELDSEFFPALCGYANHPNVEIRAHTMLCMQRQGVKAIPILCKGLHDPAALVRSKAINSLALFDSKGKDGIESLLLCLNDPDKEVRGRAANAIRRIAPEQYELLKPEQKIE